MMSLSADGPTGAPSAPADTVCGSAGPPADVSRSSVARCARDSVCPPLQAKPILTPPMFTFQRINAPVKRRSEEELNGTGMNKRARSLTCPSLLSWPRKVPCNNGRRVRSCSLSCLSPSPVSGTNVFMPSNMHRLISGSASTVSPRAKVKNTQPRPSTPPEPKHWRAYNMPHLSRVSGDTAEDLSRVTVSLPSSDSPMEQQTPPKTSRTLSQTTVDVAGSIQFVFGENMSERVLSPQKSPCGEEMSGTDCSSNDSDSSSSEASNTMTVQSTLWESAAAYTNACRRRCLPKQVKVFTGEENESNVVQLTCKLFVLERGSHSWRERGRGILRLNDLKRGARGCLQSRMVMRHEGNLKVILNTKLYAHTHLRRPTRCNLQLTATDVESRGVRVFLIQASARDVARLYVAVHHRLVALRCSSASVALGDGDTETALADRDGPCSNEEEEDDEEEEAEEDAIFITHVRSGDCNWRHSHSRLRP
ncbi:ran-binding protein 3-like isoform X2 [Electrophorus electricus]|uniref:ran-binding protein 3-like isoform X2 n=1 Tax=Electrophorus electricus TaxID=8005 RepID=UPI0015D053A1|nr:ran-binding protein 3-like isoform X2 [Electrophorus electricus]